MASPRDIDFRVPDRLDGASVRDILVEITQLPRDHIDRLLAEGAVIHGRRRVRDPRFRARRGARIQATLRVVSSPQVDLATRILFRSDDLIVLDKPAGLPSAPTRQSARSAVPELLQIELGLPSPPRVVHRLDREVSGVLALALTKRGARRLTEAFVAGETVKEYHALCRGVPAEPRGEITAPIARDPARRGRMRVHPSGAPGRTGFEVLEVLEAPHSDSLSRLSLRLHTGRTHQIRLHLAHLGCPLLGDRLYGGPDLVTLDGARLRAPGLCLRAVHLRLPGAVVGTHHPVSFRVSSPDSVRQWLGVRSASNPPSEPGAT